MLIKEGSLWPMYVGPTHRLLENFLVNLELLFLIATPNYPLVHF